MIAIDPGAKGAIVYDTEDGVVSVKMPDTTSDLWDAIVEARFGGGESTRSLYCVIEDVGTYMPGNSATAAVKFANHCGQLLMAAHGVGLQTILVRPQAWQKWLGGMPKEKPARKRKIKELMQLRFPELKVTEVNADALAMLAWGLANYKGPNSSA